MGNVHAKKLYGDAEVLALSPRHQAEGAARASHISEGLPVPCLY